MNVAIYVRNKTTNHNDIPCQTSQGRTLQEWCESHNHSVNTVRQESEPTASVEESPVQKRMMEEACAPNTSFQAVVVTNTSRISWNIREFFLCEERLNQHRIKLISVEQPETELYQKLKVAITGLLDEYERTRKSNYVKRAMLNNARNGYFNGGVPPFGYRTIENRLVVHHEESAIVQEIFNRYVSCFQNVKIYTFSEIATSLNKLGHRYRRRSWTGRNVRRILENSVYMGQYIFNKLDSKTGKLKAESEWVRSAIEPIIDHKVFEEAQSALTKSKIEKE